MVLLEFKQKFIEKYSTLTNFDEYEKSVEEFARKSIRVNAIKSTISEVKKLLKDSGWKLNNVPWCKEGFYVEHEEGRRDIGNAKGHKEGLYFVQKSVSMIPSLALDVSSKHVVLDMAAAPGAKTTHLACLMKNKGMLVANEPDRYRMNGLKKNLERCGVTNCIITTSRGEDMKGDMFNRILVDAPCSGSGLIKGKKQKSKQLLKEWNPKYIKKMSFIQKKMVMNAFDLLDNKGILVYSTCSLEPEENEAVVDYLLDKKGGKLVKIDLPVKAKDKKYMRIWPQDNGTEGFFIAKIKKG